MTCQEKRTPNNDSKIKNRRQQIGFQNLWSSAPRSGGGPRTVGHGPCQCWQTRPPEHSLYWVAPHVSQLLAWPEGHRKKSSVGSQYLVRKDFHHVDSSRCNSNKLNPIQLNSSRVQTNTWVHFNFSFEFSWSNLESVSLNAQFSFHFTSLRFNPTRYD